jgi:[ribosomal protein S18]-alanine N-acetyltransferase
MKGLPLNIRAFRDSDLTSLCEIDRICFSAPITFSRADFTACLKHPGSIARVGEGLGRILGFVMACVETSQWAHVITLDVVPEARRSGVGMRLMNALHGELYEQGIGIAVLEVSVLNLAAQRLYEKLKYRYLETLPGYYHGSEDAFRMARVDTGYANASEQDPR